MVTVLESLVTRVSYFLQLAPSSLPGAVEHNGSPGVVGRRAPDWLQSFRLHHPAQTGGRPLRGRDLHRYEIRLDRK